MTDAGEYPRGGLDVFGRMLRDAQVRACLTTKRLSVLSERVEVHPAGESALARRAASAVEAALESVPGGAAGIVEGALDALASGYAVGEMVWEPDGSLGRVAWHDPRRFAFHADAGGAVAEVEVVDAGVRLPVERFVVYSYQARYGNPYGESDLVAAYRAWATKEQVRRMWLSALDRFGAPTPVARVPGNWSQEEIDDLSRTLGRLQNEASLVIPADVELDRSLLDSGRAEPARSFVTAIRYEDAQIARAILGQELTTQGGGDSGGGSYALGKVHADVATDWVQALRAEVAERVLTDQVARRVCLTALGPDAPCPRVAFPNLTPGEMDARRQLVRDLVSGAIVAPSEGWVRRYLGIPEVAAGKGAGTDAA